MIDTLNLWNRCCLVGVDIRKVMTIKLAVSCMSLVYVWQDMIINTLQVSRLNEANLRSRYILSTFYIDATSYSFFFLFFNYLLCNNTQRTVVIPYYKIQYVASLSYCTPLNVGVAE